MRIKNIEDRIKNEISEGKHYQVINDGITYLAVKDKNGEINFEELYNPEKDIKIKDEKIKFNAVLYC